MLELDSAEKRLALSLLLVTGLAVAGCHSQALALKCSTGQECHYCPSGTTSASDCYYYHCTASGCTNDGANNPAPTPPSPSNPLGPHCQGGLTCGLLQANCGSPDDGCDTNTSLKCGSECPSGEVCDAVKFQCGACNPRTCSQQNASCGSVSDGCGGILDCTAEVGGCTAPLLCGGGGQPNQCGCTPITCQQANAVCGTIPDGCGGTVNCDEVTGGCPSGQVCNQNGTNTCSIIACVPATCASLGNPPPCGPVSDGCGNTLYCTQCEAGYICNKLSHVCQSFSPPGATGPVNTTSGNGQGSAACGDQQCGSVIDACSVSHSCGGDNCTGGTSCIGGRCQACTPITACPPEACGTTYPNGCGGTLNCSDNPIGCLASGPSNCSYVKNGVCQIPGQICSSATQTCINGNPQTCGELGYDCDYNLSDGNGGLLNCNTCPGCGCTGPSVCGGAGVAHVCGITADEAACLAHDATCGTVEDACGNPFPCGAYSGGCTPGDRCNTSDSCVMCAGSDYYQCGAGQYYANHCGTNLNNNCNGTISCGCAGNFTCSMTAGKPGGPSAPNGVPGICVCDKQGCNGTTDCGTGVPDGCGIQTFNCSGSDPNQPPEPCPADACDTATHSCCPGNGIFNTATQTCCAAGVDISTATPLTCCASGQVVSEHNGTCCTPITCQPGCELSSTTPAATFDNGCGTGTVGYCECNATPATSNAECDTATNTCCANNADYNATPASGSAACCTKNDPILVTEGTGGGGGGAGGYCCPAADTTLITTNGDGTPSTTTACCAAAIDVIWPDNTETCCRPPQQTDCGNTCNRTIDNTCGGNASTNITCACTGNTCTAPDPSGPNGFWECCPSGDLVTGTGACCNTGPSGGIEPNGNCCASPNVLDVNGNCCAAADIATSTGQNVCCPSDVVASGVCCTTGITGTGASPTGPAGLQCCASNQKDSAGACCDPGYVEATANAPGGIVGQCCLRTTTCTAPTCAGGTTPVYDNCGFNITSTCPACTGGEECDPVHNTCCPGGGQNCVAGTCGARTDSCNVPYTCDCPYGETCSNPGGSGTCGTCPQTCSNTYPCGGTFSLCGNSTDCPPCATGDICYNNSCCLPTNAACASNQCAGTVESCGENLPCTATCSGGQVCGQNNLCCTPEPLNQSCSEFGTQFGNLCPTPGYFTDPCTGQQVSCTCPGSGGG